MLIKVRDRLRLQLGLRLELGCRFIFYLHLLPFYQAFCCCHLGGKIDTACFFKCLQQHRNEQAQTFSETSKT